MSTQEKNEEQPKSYQYTRPESIKSWRSDVYEALSYADMPEMATRWKSCSEFPKTKINAKAGAKIPANAEVVFVCSGNHQHDLEVYAQTCDLRICPDCARRHAARLAARYTPKMLEVLHQHHRTHRFRLVTFTLPYSLDEVDIRQKYLDGFEQVYRVMDEMMVGKNPDWKKEQGFFTTAEFGSEGHKLHYHVIHYGQYLEQGELSRRWFTATDGAAYVVDVRALVRKGKPLEEAVQEVFKYAVKFFSKDKETSEVKCIPAQLIPALAMALAGTRRVRSYGIFYNIPEPDAAEHICDICSSKMVGIPVTYFETFLNTGMLPREFWLANRAAELQYKPADKSPAKSTASPPETPDDIRKRQIQMDVIKKMKWTAKDEF